MSEVDALFDRADSLLENNQIPEAKQLYAQIAGLAPDHADAWLMLGLIEQEQANPAQAEAHLRRAIGLDEHLAEAHLNLANMMRLQGRQDEAAHHADQAVRSDAEYTEAWLFLAATHQAQGKPEDAVAAYRRAVQLDPGLTEAWLQLAGLYMRLDDAEQSVSCYEQAVSLAPDHAEAHNRLAGALMRLQRYDQAQAHIGRALAVRPDYAEAHASQGNLLLRSSDLQGAAACFRQALQIEPNLAGALVGLGYVHRQQKQFHEAVACYEKALQAEPDLGVAFLGLGDAYLKLGNPEKAAHCFELALGKSPLDANACLNLGFALKLQGRLEEARAQFVRALDIDPALASAHYNLGLTHKHLGNYAEAENRFRRALALEPANADAQLSLSLISLLLGKLKDGWLHYRTRPSVPEGISTPEPLAGNLHGKRILVVKDQGIGDEIFFLRFASLLKARGPSINYMADPKIASLVARLPFIDQVVGPDEASGPMDVTVSIGDLPFVLGLNDMADIPAPVQLPVLDQARHAARRELDKLGNGPYIGITWWAGIRQSGVDLGEGRAFREVSLPLLVEVLRGVDARIVVLQRNPSREDLAYLTGALGSRVLDLSPLNNDLESMLAVLSLLDDYLGVDNTNMHLSASMNKPCRILVPHPPEWRSMASGNQSIWFPGFKLYRQTPEGSWTTAMQELQADLIPST